MELVKKFKDVLTSVIPIVILVSVCQLFVPLPKGYFPHFLIGSVYVIFGLTLFLLGVDIGVVPVGESIGSHIMKKRSLVLLIVVGFVVGFGITYAEPNAEVLASQAALVNPSINASSMLLMLSVGVGVFIAFAFLRLVLHISLRVLLLVSYIVIFVLAFLSDSSLVSLAFDGGGAATGPMAVPFIMALGIGSARVRADAKDVDNFGFVGLQATGAIMAVLVMGLFSHSSKTGSVAFSYPVTPFVTMFEEQLGTVTLSLLPLVVIVFLFQFVALHMPRIQFLRVIMGLVYSYVGMTLFLTGANSGFMPVGFVLGSSLAKMNPVLLVLVGLVLGALVVLAEPSVHVLVIQVEEISNGRITKGMMLSFLASGVALAVAMALLRVVFGFPILYVLVPCYVLSFIMLFTGPKLFGAIAFDSGGVAAGPMAATFILPFVIGAGTFAGSDPFGVLGCISMAPLVTIQLLGLVYQQKIRKGGKK